MVLRSSFWTTHGTRKKPLSVYNRTTPAATSQKVQRVKMRGKYFMAQCLASVCRRGRDGAIAPWCLSNPRGPDLACKTEEVAVPPLAANLAQLAIGRFPPQPRFFQDPD